MKRTKRHQRHERRESLAEMAAEERCEHPWLTRTQSYRIARDHKRKPTHHY